MVEAAHVSFWRTMQPCQLGSGRAIGLQLRRLAVTSISIFISGR
jgi:hypothetical protein